MANQHFFQPLLPGFHSHLTIPVAFFLKNIQGRYEQKTAELRSDASKIIWKVKLDGRRLTDGWKEFALSHNLQVGDIVVFRQEKDMSFHVTLLGPSCCEIQYGSCLEDESESEKIQEESKKRSRETESSSLDSSCFVANVSPSSLRYDLLYLPKRFVRENGIVTGSGNVVLMSENGRRSWTLKLRQKPSCGTAYIRGGWRSFCGANRLKARDYATFKLIHRGATMALRFVSSKEPEEEETDEAISIEPESEEKSNIGKIEMKKNPIREIESSSIDPSCFVANVSHATLRYDILYLPKKFVRANGVDTRSGEIVLMNEKGRSWTLDLKRKKSCGTTYIRRGWRSFCLANGLVAGSFLTFKLIRKGRTLVLSLSRKEPEEEEEECSETNEVESLSTEQETDEENSQEERISQECLRIKGEKSRLIWKPSSSPSQNRFVTLTLRPYNINCNILRLPLPFTRMNNINEETKMTMLDKHGVKWPVNLRSENEKYKRIRLGGSWKDFLKANSVKTNESIRLELIREEDTSCVLKFCSKVKL